MASQKKSLEDLIAGYSQAEDLIGENGLLDTITKLVMDRVREIKNKNSMVMTEPARYNPENDYSQSHSLNGLEDKITQLYAKGLSLREVQGYLDSFYNLKATTQEIQFYVERLGDLYKIWQSRHLNPFYPMVYFDTLPCKTRDADSLQNRTMYLALGVSVEGNKDILGLWSYEESDNNAYAEILKDLKHRGVQEVFIFSGEDAPNLRLAAENIYSNAQTQMCITCTVRSLLGYVSWKDKKEIAVQLKQIYQADTLPEAVEAFEQLNSEWNTTYASVLQHLEREWDEIQKLFSYPPEVRKSLYAMNSLEQLNTALRQSLKNRGTLQSNGEALTLLFSGVQTITRKWTMPLRDWKAAFNKLTTLFEPKNLR